MPKGKQAKAAVKKQSAASVAYGVSVVAADGKLLARPEAGSGITVQEAAEVTVSVPFIAPGSSSSLA